MTMKIAVLLSVSLFSASVFVAATTQSSNTFGLLRVDSTQKQTIVCVPWVASSAADDQNIKVTDIVKTANLTVGDELYWYDSAATNYKAWNLVPGGEGKAPKWEAATSVTSAGVNPGTSAENTAVARGNAIILLRQNPTNELGRANSFFLIGQVAQVGNVENILPKAAVDDSDRKIPVYSLLAPPFASSADTFDLNGTGVVWDMPNDEDVINIPDRKVTLSWNKTAQKWGVCIPTLNGPDIVLTWTYDSAVITSGCGAWYVNGGSSDVKVTWKAQ